MKNTKIYLLKTAIVGVLVITTVASCKKKEVIMDQPKNDVMLEQSKTSNVSITDLKKYFGELTHLDTSKIYYNSNLQKFFINGKEQMSYEELKENYLKFPIVHYKDGLSTVK